MLYRFVILVTPFEVAFSSPIPKLDWLFVLNRLIDVVFLADLAMNFFVAQFDMRVGRWMLSMNAILTSYRRFWLIVDVVRALSCPLCDEGCCSCHYMINIRKQSVCMREKDWRCRA